MSSLQGVFIALCYGWFEAVLPDGYLANAWDEDGSDLLPLGKWPEERLLKELS